MIRTGTFRYVAFDRVEEFHRLGWMVVAPLGFWSVLMWACSCPYRKQLNAGASHG